MSENSVEARLDGQECFSSFSRMMGYGEGIYASSASADVGIHQTGQIGLTLSPKTKTGEKLLLDTFIITDKAFGEALKGLEPLLVDHEGANRPFQVDPIPGACRNYVAAPSKRRKLSGGFYDTPLQKSSPSPVTWPTTVSFFAQRQQEAIEHFLQPTLCTAPLEPGRAGGDSQHQGDRYEMFCHEPFGSAHPLSENSLEEVQAMQGDCRKRPLSVNVDEKPVQLINFESIPSKGHQSMFADCNEIKTIRYEHLVSMKDSEDRSNKSYKPGTSSSVGVGGKSSDEAYFDQYNTVLDPDGLMPYIEKNLGQEVNCQTKTGNMSGCSLTNSALHDVSTGLISAQGHTMAGVHNVSANKTTQKPEPSQDSLQPSQQPSKTPTLASIARIFLRRSRQALVEGFSRSLLSHQIPPELQQLFEALLRRFQVDKQFQEAVVVYAMELTGALPPADKKSSRMSAKLRQGFDVIAKKVASEKDFRMSVEKFVICYLEDRKFSEESGSLELDHDKLVENAKQSKNLDGLSIEEITRHYRNLEDQCLYYANEARKAKDAARCLQKLEDGEPRRLHAPREAIPMTGKWTCFHPKTKKGKNEPCGHSNPYFERKIAWDKIEICKACGLQYEEVFEQQKLATPKKNYYKSKAKAPNPGGHQSPDKSQAGDQGNAPIDGPANSHVSDLNIVSTLPDDLLYGAFPAEIYGNLVENDSQDAGHMNSGWTSNGGGLQHIPESDRLHITSMANPLSSPSGDPVGHSPMQKPGIQSSGLGYMDALNVNLDLTGSDGEFDEFAIDNDPLFVDSPIDCTLQKPSHASDCYPARLNLIPNSIDTHSQSQPSLDSSHHLSAIGSSKDCTGQRYISNSIQHGGSSRNLAPNQLGWTNRTYLSPHNGITDSALPQPANTTIMSQAGTLLSFPASNGMTPLNSATVPWNTGATNSASSPANLQVSELALFNMPTSLTTSYPNQTTVQTLPSTVIADADSEKFTTGGQVEHSSPSRTWTTRVGRRPTLYKKPQEPKKRRDAAQGETISGNTPNHTDPSAPLKKQRLSRAKAAMAERAAMRSAAAAAKTPQPDKPFTEAQLSNIKARNGAAAAFLGGLRKSWEEPVERHCPKVIIEIPDDEAEAEEASEVPQGAVADQDASDALDEAFNAEFARQDRAAALGVFDEGGDGGKEN